MVKVFWFWCSRPSEKCRPSAMVGHQMSAKLKSGQVLSWPNLFVPWPSEWMAKCNECPSEYQANWKKWQSAILTKFVYKVVKWINGQMPWVAKWMLSKVEKVVKFCNWSCGRHFGHFWHFREDLSDHSQTTKIKKTLSLIIENLKND